MNDEVYLHRQWIILVMQSLFNGKWQYEATHKTFTGKVIVKKDFHSEEAAIIDAKNEIDKRS